MSAGNFIRSFYQTDAGGVAAIRIQPETAGTSNPAATGPATIPVSAKVSNSNRSVGIKPRMVSIVFESGAPDGYEEGSILRIPILTPATYNALTVGGTFAYLGASATVVGKSPERIR